MGLADFMQLKEVLETGLTEAQLLALRFYTSHSFHAINKPLRANQKPHPLPAIVTCINEGIKTLRGLDAESEEATAAFDLLISANPRPSRQGGRGLDDSQLDAVELDLLLAPRRLNERQRRVEHLFLTGEN